MLPLRVARISLVHDVSWRHRQYRARPFAASRERVSSHYRQQAGSLSGKDVDNPVRVSR